MSYWSERQDILYKQLEKDEEKLKQRLSGIYNREATEISKEIASFYQRYGVDNILEYRRMLESLSDADKQLLYERFDLFVQKYPQYQDLLPVRENIYKLDRLEGLNASIQMTIAEGYVREVELISAHEFVWAEKQIENSCNFLGIEYNPEIASLFVDAKWFNGESFSDLLWKDKQKLQQYISQDLAQGLARGDTYRELTDKLLERFGNVSRKDAYRLVYTEGTYVMAESSIQPFTADFEYYTISTARDGRVCEDCYDIETHSESEPFRIEDRSPGNNFPPFHPWCRCSWEIYVADWDKWIDDYVTKYGEEPSDFAEKFRGND